ncbi:MAG: DNA mismatch repair protein MutS, partial [Alphaproteobacteria bacterium]|nr:DNA mismatch repair protein MutS [Alphaproteobacteria bacterium]
GDGRLDDSADDDAGGSGGRELLRLPAEIYSEWRDAITEVSAVADDDEAKSVLAEMTRKLVASRAKKTGEDDKPGEDEKEKAAGTGENGWLRLAGKIDKWHAAERHALAELLLYIEHTQVSRLPRLSPPRRDASARTLQMDAATRANLELTRKRDGARAGSLLATMDRTESGAGARLLASWLAAPLADAEKINERLDGVEFLARNPDLRRRVVNKLGKLPETERAMARLSLGRGGPRDLAAARDGLELAARIAAVLDDPAFRDGDLPKILEETDAELARTVIGTPVPELRRTLKNALASPLPSAAQNGGYIRADYDHRLKKLRDAENESRRKIAALQEKYIRSTGVPSLRIRHNRVLGYYIEVGRSFAAKLPQTRDSPFSLRQSIANAVRYTTEELREMQDNLASASARSIALEESIFIGLCDAVHEQADHILTALRAAARIDVLCALAAHAAEREWTRPILADEPVFNVKAGRHPVVEAALAESGADFVANDCVLGGKAPRLTLLTGPNMAGKSTYLRQNALILILAQTGSFVPAESLTLGVADRLFSRIGAADDLARGHSTFMVEMLETAQILRGANENSFVILDELGRGTSTHDGLALAWAASEHLHAVNRCRTLFATHYHELAPLYEELPDALTMQMRVREWRGEIVFLHEAAPGAAHASYGLHVARLAGVPEPIVSRAAVILAGFEGTAHRPDARTEPPPPLPRSLRTMHPVLKALTKVKPDNLAPKEALEILYQLRNQLREMEKKK